MILPLQKCRHVIFKLLGFTLAMVVLPIGSYFLTVHTIFKGTIGTPPASGHAADGKANNPKETLL